MLIFEISYHVIGQEISNDVLLIHLHYKPTFLLMTIARLLLCLLFCVELREQNQFSRCLALHETRFTDYRYETFDV